ncbi:MAG: DUF3592 domain-containing protein [Lachnospiraceae bacterium]|nr:DUF3592 domain-containing protein [Lachnospiraceae bacterium]
MTNTAILLAVVIIGVIGIGTIILGSSLIRKNRKCTQRVTAVITDIVSTGTGAVAPKFTYTVSGGEERTVKHMISVSPALCKYRLGETVQILYNPENPDQYALDGKSPIKIKGIVFICSGVMCLVSAGIMAVISAYIV